MLVAIVTTIEGKHENWEEIGIETREGRKYLARDRERRIVIAANYKSAFIVERLRARARATLMLSVIDAFLPCRAFLGHFTSS